MFGLGLGVRAHACLGLLLGAASLCAQGVYDFSDTARRHSYRLSATEHYVTAQRSSAAPSLERRLLAARGTQSLERVGNRGLIIHRSGEGKRVRSALRATAGITSVAPVFYDMEELPSEKRLASLPPAEREKRLAGARRVMTEKLLVKLNGGQWTALQSKRPLSREDSLIKGWSLVRFADADAALAAAEWMGRSGTWEYSPVFARQLHLRQVAASPLQRTVNDPLFPNQWHLANDVPGIGMQGSWDVVTGKGINIVVVDNGVELTHEDLAANAYPLESGYHRNFQEGDPGDPTPVLEKTSSNHGTACAGLAAARGFNNLGVIGVAPDARIMGVRLLGDMSADDADAGALAWQPAGLVTHVSSNSWGAEDDGKALGRIGAQEAAALELGATTYRDGLGVIYVVSAGNGRSSGDNSNYDAFAGSRFVIGVGAVNRDGEQSSFSEDGMNVAISAVGGEFQPPAVVWTTNISGAEMQAMHKTDFETTKAPIHYTDAFNGTSAAAPQVSGAAALMLERNPRLGYRDVKEILMRTARRTGLKGGDPFVTNSAGISFSHSFGAGLLNVAAAVDMAGSWTNLGPQVSVSASASGSAAIPDGAAPGAMAELDLSGQPSIRVESVEIVVDVDHPNRGEVGFVIESPSGMKSIVETRTPDDGENFKSFQFMSVRHWGERSNGVWKVSAIDTEANGDTGALRAVTIRLYGAAQ